MDDIDIGATVLCLSRRRFVCETEHEKAYQKQGAIFVARKRAIGNERQKPMRFVRNVGLGIKTPDAAIEGNFVDKKCPFTGNVSIRGRILKGMVISISRRWKSRRLNAISIVSALMGRE